MLKLEKCVILKSARGVIFIIKKMNTKTKKGFTLVELLIIMGLIGVLSSITAVSLNSSLMKARDARRITELRQIWLALRIYAEGNNGKYPDSLKGLNVVLPTDPTTGQDYFYCASGTKDGVNDGRSFHLGTILERTPDPYLETDADVQTDGCENLAGNSSFHGNATGCSGAVACNTGECEDCFDLSSTEIFPVSGSSSTASGSVEGCGAEIDKNWEAIGSNGYWSSIAMSDNGIVQTATTYQGKLHISSDSGKTWSDSGLSKQWSGVAMSSDGKIQTAAAHDGTLYVSNDYGNNWESKESARIWRTVAMSSDGKFQTAITWAVDYIYVSSDYGNTWTPKGTKGPWITIAMSSDGKIQTAAGMTTSMQKIYTSSDYGETWTARDRRAYWRSVSMSSDGKIQTGVAFSGMDGKGRIYVSNDYGISWSEKVNTNGLFLTNVDMSEDGKIQTASVYNGQLQFSNDYGATWTPFGTKAVWNDVAVSADGSKQAAVAYEGQIYVSSCK